MQRERYVTCHKNPWCWSQQGTWLCLNQCYCGLSKSRDFQPLDLFSLPILHVSVKLCSNAKAFSAFFSNFVSKFLASWLHIVLLYSMIFWMHCYCKKWLFFFQLQCKIEFDKERRQFFIYDVGSRNGTFLNGLRLSEVSSITVIRVKCMKYYIWTSGKKFRD